MLAPSVRSASTFWQWIFSRAPADLLLDGLDRAQLFNDPGEHSTLFNDVAFHGEFVRRDAVQLGTR